MKFNDLLQRADLNSLESFLKYGSDDFVETTDKTYSQRIEDATKKATAFFEAKYSDIDEYDKISGYFYEQLSVFEEIYFEIGLILGAKIAFQIGKRMEELT